MNQTKKLKFTRQPDTGCLSEEDAKRYFSTVGLAMVALMLVYYATSIAMAYAIAILDPSILENAILSHVPSLVALYGVALPVFCLILRRLPKGIPSGVPLSGGVLLGGFGMTAAMMMAGNYVSQVVIAFFENAMGAQQENPVATMTENLPWWVNLIFVAIIPCIFEELLFRKALCDRLLPLGEGYAVVISAVAFGLIHGNFFQFFYAFAVGLVFGAIYVKTGRIWITVLYHGLINLLSGVLISWILDQLTPLLEESTLIRMEEYLATGDAEALNALVSPYMLPMLLLLAYEAVMLGATVIGLVFFFRRGRRIRFQSGLLPVPRSCRVSAVLLNVGCAAALTVFAAIFLLSLL